jgi:hypothetical protein
MADLFHGYNSDTNKHTAYDVFSHKTKEDELEGEGARSDEDP